MEKCKYCQNNNLRYQLKIIPSGRTDISFFPKYIPQVKISCGDCGKFIKFVAQTQELINEINKKLDDYMWKIELNEDQDTLF